MRRRDRHAHDARLERPEQALREAGGLRLPVPGVGDVLAVGSACVNAFIMFSASVAASGSVSTTFAASKASSATGSAASSTGSPPSSISTCTGEQSAGRLEGERLPHGALLASAGCGTERLLRPGISAGILTHAEGVAVRALAGPVDPAAALAALAGGAARAAPRRRTAVAADPAEVGAGRGRPSPAPEPRRTAPRWPAAGSGCSRTTSAAPSSGCRTRGPIRRPPLAVARYDTVALIDDDGRCQVASAAGDRELDELAATVAGAAPPPLPPPVARQAVTSLPGDAYRAAVEAARELIRAGDCYQINVAQRLTVPWDEPLALARRLWSAAGPAARRAYLALPEGAVASASPELLVSLRDGVARSEPIKGTAPLGMTAELAVSAKDRAEHVMIVDLVRNDLGRVALGGVRVARLFDALPTPYVEHLVSEVVADLREDAGPRELLRAVFPGGSVTGCPKVRAMEVIRDLEPVGRGPAYGSVVALGADGSLEASVAIRTAWLAGGRRATGAGEPWWDSDPGAERPRPGQGRALPQRHPGERGASGQGLAGYGGARAPGAAALSIDDLPAVGEGLFETMRAEGGAGLLEHHLEQRRRRPRRWAWRRCPARADARRGRRGARRLRRPPGQGAPDRDPAAHAGWWRSPRGAGARRAAASRRSACAEPGREMSSPSTRPLLRRAPGGPAARRGGRRGPRAAAGRRRASRRGRARERHRRDGRRRVHGPRPGLLAGRRGPSRWRPAASASRSCPSRSGGGPRDRPDQRRDRALAGRGRRRRRSGWHPGALARRSPLACGRRGTPRRRPGDRWRAGPRRARSRRQYAPADLLVSTARPGPGAPGGRLELLPAREVVYRLVEERIPSRSPTSPASSP